MRWERREGGRKGRALKKIPLGNGANLGKENMPDSLLLSSLHHHPLPSVNFSSQLFFFYHALSACVWLYFSSISSPSTSNYQLPVPAVFFIMLCLLVFDSISFPSLLYPLLTIDFLSQHFFVSCYVCLYLILFSSVSSSSYSNYQLSVLVFFIVLGEHCLFGESGTLRINDTTPPVGF